MPQQTLIIGAGIVGLHIANALLDKGHEVFVLEKESYLAEHTSGRNSGVIHAGIFYQTGSFKEEICIAGNALTYEWVHKLNVPHRPTGKWVIPEPDQIGDMEAFYERVRQLPIPAPRLYDANAVSTEEPLLRKTPAVFIPSTGVLDASTYVKSMARYIESRGATIILNCHVTGIGPNKLETSRGEIEFDCAINCAGLCADEIAKMTGVTEYEIRPCRGDYYLINAAPLTRPVYHLPHRGGLGLGVHLTPTFDNQTLLGPNAYFIDRKDDYHHASTKDAYEAALAHDLPDYKHPPLQVAYSGNRPKLYHNGQAQPEFVFFKRDNWIHVLGIESPGLTAAPALAKYVTQLM